MIVFPDNAVTPRPAATVMVARPLVARGDVSGAASGEDYAVFMLRRSAKSAFVPDVYVFPGGGLEQDDSSDATQAMVIGLTIDEANAGLHDAGSDANVLRDPAPATPLDPAQTWGLYYACARELFEEAAILLTSPAAALPLYQNPARLLELRAALNSHDIFFHTVLQKLGVTLDLSRLIYFSRWITPAIEPRRYDTRFFFAALTAGEGEEAAADERETTAGVWITPSAALARHAVGDFGMVYPTIEHLKRLAAHPKLTDATAYARTKEIIAVSPDSIAPQSEGERFDFRLRPETEGRW